MSTKEKQDSTQKSVNPEMEKIRMEQYLLSQADFYRRLDYLFKVIEMKDKLPEDIVSNACEGIRLIIGKPNETNQHSEN